MMPDPMLFEIVTEDIDPDVYAAVDHHTKDGKFFQVAKSSGGAMDWAIKTYATGPMIGNGLFARVFDCGKDHVLKIFFDNDAGYMNYLRAICELGDNNKYLPRIEHAIHYKNTEVYEDTFSENLARGVVIVKMEKLRGRNRWSNLRSERMVRWAGAMRRAIHGADKQYRQPHRDLYALIALAYELAHPDDVTVDLHTGNIMFRGITPVITDPLC